MTKHKPDTKVTTLGRDPEANFGIVNPPIYRASTILYPTVEALRNPPTGHNQLRYGRYGTPTTFSLQEAIADLEGAAGTVAVSSGAAAITAALAAFVETGDHVLVVDCAYEPGRKFCDGVLKRFGVRTTYFDPALGAGVARLFEPRTKAILLEAPGSLTFEMQDVPAIARVARQHGIKTLVDNTWATPLYFKPLAHGADVSIISATKYIGGHSDLMMGLISANAESFEQLRAGAYAFGHHASPEDCWLALRGLRTLAVRLKRHHETGLIVARWLQARTEVKRVMHPALPQDPGHALWKRDFTGASGLFSAVLHPVTPRQFAAFCDHLELHGMGASWGGYESLALPSDPRRARTVCPWNEDGELIRFHAGLEDPDDLIADLEAGFARMKQA